MAKQKAYHIIINNFIDVKLETTTPYKTIKLLKKLNINIEKIKYNKDSIVIRIKKSNYTKIKKLYKTNIINEYGITRYLSQIKINKINIIYTAITICLIMLLSNIIVKIEINSTNIELNSKILNELDKQNINKISFKKTPDKIQNIQNTIKNNLKNELEWINITTKGMKYQIKIEPKIIKNKIEQKDFCNIIAKKEGTITRIISSKGIEKVEKNDIVKTGDVLISGDIIYNDQIKGQTCAIGKVYAKTWYTIELSIPKYYEHIEEQNKKRYNIEIKYNNKKTKIFKTRVKNSITKNKKILNIFGREIYLQKEIEIKKNTKEYTEDQINNLIDEKIKEKMKNMLDQEISILDRKVLKKEENNSKINIVMFIVVEELISETTY